MGRNGDFLDVYALHQKYVLLYELLFGKIREPDPLFRDFVGLHKRIVEDSTTDEIFRQKLEQHREEILTNCEVIIDKYLGMCKNTSDRSGINRTINRARQQGGDLDIGVIIDYISKIELSVPLFTFHEEE